MKFIDGTSLITQNKTFTKILSDLRTVIDTNSSILLTGETGVGKELLAEFIHRNSNRKEEPFIKVGLSALPAELLESELFGHEKGAYTSASNEKKGLFELANRGSLFLDDIDDFPFVLQSKLLRVLEEREIMRIGGERTIPVDVRLITASKLDLKNLVDEGIFRADLFYRINVVPINLPPLRQRIDDISALVNYFIERFAGERIITITPDAIEALMNYRWPGNVRELKNIIHRVVLFCDSEIQVKDLPNEIVSYNHNNEIIQSCQNCLITHKMSFKDTINCLEANLIREALNQCSGNKLAAAKLLEMPASTFNDKLTKYKSETEDIFLIRRLVLK